MLMIQGLLISGSFMLSHLAKSRAGVMRHIYTKRLAFEQGFLYSDKLHLLIYLFTFFGILILILYKYKKHPTNFFEKAQIFIFSLTLFSSILVIKSNFFISLLSHPYILIAFLISLFIQFLFLLILFFQGKQVF